MAVKKTGISRDLIIHPGETIADVLEERGISQTELSERTGVSKAYISNVIAGKKDISSKFAFALEYALGVPKSFWLNLQANYDAELLEFNEAQTITEEERTARESLKDIVKHLRNKKSIPVGEKKDDSILSLRKALQISNLANLNLPEEVGRVIENHQLESQNAIKQAVEKETGRRIGISTISAYLNERGIGKQILGTCRRCGLNFYYPRNKQARMHYCSYECRMTAKQEGIQRRNKLRYIRPPQTPTYTASELRQRTRNARRNDLYRIECERRAEGKYDTYGTYVAAKECQIRIVFPDWVERRPYEKRGH